MNTPIILSVMTVALLVVVPRVVAALVDDFSRPRIDAKDGAASGIQDKGPKYDKTRQIMEIVVSIALLISGLYVLLSMKYAQPEKQWAYGSIGFVAGFWLKGK